MAKTTIEEVMNELNKTYKDSIITQGLAKYEYRRIPLTSPRLNYMLYGGLPTGKLIEFYGENHGGKALSLDCDILTPTGYRKMRDIQVGDSVIDGEGKRAIVIGVFPQGVKPMYRFTFADHSSIECSDEHLWEVNYHGCHAIQTKVLSASEIASTYKKAYNGGRNHFMYSVNTPIVHDIDYNKNLPIDPYLLGVLLGDGCLGNSGVSVSLSEADLIEKVSDLLVDWDMSLQHNGGVDYDIRHNQNPYDAVRQRGTSLRKELDNLGLRCNSINKHIPKEYLYTTVENRIRLLQGLFDTDGYTEKRGAAIFSTSSSQLSEDFAFLVRSLGGIDMVTSDIGQYKDADGNLVDCNMSYSHHLVFRNGIIPCTSAKHLNRYKPLRVGMYFRKIVKVEEIEPKECQCIKVDSDCHTFIAENVTVTHNTTTALDAVANYQRLPNAKGVLYADVENTLDAEWAEKLGVDLDTIYLLQPKGQGAETIFDMITKALDTGDIGLCVIDSLGAMMSNQAFEKAIDEKTYGGISMALTAFSKKAEMLAAKHNITIIGINQERADMNSPYGGMKTTGGECWKYLCSVRLEFRMGKYIDEKGNDLTRQAENPAGNYVLVTMKKNKTCPPNRRTGFYTIRYEIGIDYLKDLVEVAIKYNLVKQSGAWFSIFNPNTGEEVAKVQGQPKVYAFLEDEANIEVLKAIEAFIDSKINEDDRQK